VKIRGGVGEISGSVNKLFLRGYNGTSGIILMAIHCAAAERGGLVIKKRKKEKKESSSVKLKAFPTYLWAA